jgi:hypothetical protein
VGRNGLYDGFESYRIRTSDDLFDALTHGIVSIDTNVLLSLYRYTETTVEDLLRVLGRIDDRLFIRHQVVHEFWRNRQTVLGNPTSAIKDTQAAIAKNRTSTRDANSRWAKSVALDATERDEILQAADDAFSKLSDRVARNSTARVDAATPTDEDPLLVRIADLLKGRVGDALDEQEWSAAVTEGERRVENSEPPGYMDVEKLESEIPERASGDYLVWYQLLKEGAEQGKDLVLVTSDTKEDWWNRLHGRSLGPRRELVREYSDATSAQVFLVEPAELLKHSRTLGIDTSHP